MARAEIDRVFGAGNIMPALYSDILEQETVNGITVTADYDIETGDIRRSKINFSFV